MIFLTVGDSSFGKKKILNATIYSCLMPSLTDRYIRLQICVLLFISQCYKDFLSQVDGHSGSGRRAAEYEVLRVEGLDEATGVPTTTVVDSDDEISFNPLVVTAAAAMSNGGRKRSRKVKRRLSAALADAELVGDSSSSSTCSSPTKMKRLRLILGKETVSTVNYSD